MSVNMKRVKFMFLYLKLLLFISSLAILTKLVKKDFKMTMQFYEHLQCVMEKWRKKIFQYHQMHTLHEFILLYLGTCFMETVV